MGSSDIHEMERRVRALGHEVRKHRLDAGLSQKAAASKWGVSSTWLSELERGRGNPTFGQLVKLVDAMGLSLTDLTR